MPEEAAPHLERVLRGNELPASIELSVTRDGKAQVKNFLLGGRPWREALAKRP